MKSFAAVTTLIFLQLAFFVAAAEDKIDVTSEVDPIGRYPYHVGLLGDVDEAPFCAGSLVATDWVLSSVRCGVESVRYVVIGSHNLTEFSIEDEYIEVEWATPHPNYTTGSHDNDYMMLKLTENSTYAPVTLDDGSSDVSDGTTVVVMGWGTECEANSDVLMEEELTVVSINFCNEYYSGNITENMICAAGDDEYSCKNDIGGPLIIKGDDNNDVSSDTLVGLVSFGEEFPDKPQVFASVGKNIAWIKNEIANGTDPNAFDFDFDFDFFVLLGFLWDNLTELGICSMLLFAFNFVFYVIIF